MRRLALLSSSPEETQRVGEVLGRHAQAGDLFLLTGGLGVGKTCLVQGLARGLGVAEPARSPSFVLVARYQGRLPLYHVDLYRLEHLEEVQDLGLEEMTEGEGVCVIEWAERAPRAFAPEHLLVTFHLNDETERRLVLEARGSRYRRLLQELAGALKET